MKKNLLLLVLLMFVLMTASVFAESSSGRLELIKGTVIYQLPGQTKWNPLTQKSADLFVGAIIQTKENSQALLSFEDGCKILIGEMTLFKVQSKEEKDKKTLFTIKLFGKTFVEVKKSGAQNNFKIQTPTALATIRGSKMLVTVGDNLITKVTSAEGTIDVASTYLYKGTVLYVEDNLITLETAEGIKKISISSETIIPERSGSSKINAGDRIAIYGLDAEEKTSSLFTGSELASLTVLPLKNDTMAATGGVVTANYVLFTSASMRNILSFSQIFNLTTNPYLYFVKKFTSIFQGYMTFIGPGQLPVTPTTAPYIPNNTSQASKNDTMASSGGNGNAKGDTQGNPTNDPVDQPQGPPSSGPPGAAGNGPPVMGAPNGNVFPTGIVDFTLL